MRIQRISSRVRRKAKRRIDSRVPWIKCWHLKGEKQQIFQHKVLEGGLWEPQESANVMWGKMAHGD